MVVEHTNLAPWLYWRGILAGLVLSLLTIHLAFRGLSAATAATAGWVWLLAGLIIAVWGGGSGGDKKLAQPTRSPQI